MLAGWLLAGWLLAAPAMALDEQALASRLARQPLPEVYRWLLAQPVPAAATRAARYHQWLGQIARRRQDTAAAITHFENAVLAYPYALGARLELALAYAEQGNAAAARASLRALHAYRGESPLPPAAARTLSELERRLAERQPGGGSWHDAAQGSLSLTQGFDSNANLGSRHRTISLNLFDQVADEAVLADASRAQSSHFSRLALSASLPASALLDERSAAAWHLQGGLGAQHYHDLDTLHRQDAYLSAEWRPPTRRTRLATSLQHQRVKGIGNAWYLDIDIRRLLGEHWLAEAGLQWQREPAGRNSYRLSAGLWHEWRGALLWGNAGWQLRPGREAGDTWRLRLGAQSPDWRWQSLRTHAYLHLDRRQDTDLYNYVFFGDRRRRETAASLGLRARLPLLTKLDLVFDAQWEETWASLELFETRRWKLDAMLRWRW